MMNHGYGVDNITLHARLRMDELQRQAAQDRRVRQVRRPHRLRMRAGTLLIAVGEALVRRSEALCADDELALAKVRC